MMDQVGQCQGMGVWLHAFIVVVNAFQAIVIAYLGARAVRKNREEAQRKHDSEP